MTFKQEARDALAEDLRQGKKVDRCTLKDLIENDLDQHFQTAAREVAGLIVAEEPDRSLYIGRYTERLIKEWLDKKEALIAERAAEFRQDYEESQRAAA